MTDLPQPEADENIFHWLARLFTRNMPPVGREQAIAKYEQMAAKHEEPDGSADD